MMKRLRFIIILLLLSSVCFSQGKVRDRVTCSFSDVSLVSILDSLGSKVDYFFSYNSAILDGTGRFTISADNQPIDQFLSSLLVGTGLEYSFFKDQIIINYRPVEVVSKRKNQFTISGKVEDENGNSLMNASVFLDGTTIGISTDIDGNFKLDKIPPGYYDLVISHVGYETIIYSISEFNGGFRIQNHKMQLDLLQLHEVEVSSNRISKNQSEWQLSFMIFRKELLGNSGNSKQCVIENPEVISFFHDTENDVLKAYATDPIQIRNDALGYRISYFLESFEKSPSNLRYRGQIRFRNAVPLKKSERKEWNRNRNISYNGSFNHFRNALLDKNLKREGFKMYDLKSLNRVKNSRNLTKVANEDLLSFKGDHYELAFKNFLLVEYHKEKESLDFLIDSKYSSILYEHLISDAGIINKMPGNQISIIKLFKKSISLDLNGQIEDRFALTTYGYWSWERLADLVPINYDPKLDKL